MTKKCQCQLPAFDVISCARAPYMYWYKLKYHKRYFINFSTLFWHTDSTHIPIWANYSFIMLWWKVSFLWEKSTLFWIIPRICMWFVQNSKQARSYIMWQSLFPMLEMSYQTIVILVAHCGNDVVCIFLFLGNKRKNLHIKSSGLKMAISKWGPCSATSDIPEKALWNHFRGSSNVAKLFRVFYSLQKTTERQRFTTKAYLDPFVLNKYIHLVQVIITFFYVY